jgi:type II secretory pathway pseudopilin PulG
MTTRLSRYTRRGERGMALLIALIVLVVVTILGVVSMRTALFQNRVSINNQLALVNFQAAESALEATMDFAIGQSNGPDGIPRTGDLGEVSITDPAHILNPAVNRPEAHRVCPRGDGTPLVAENTFEVIGTKEEEIVQGFEDLADDDALCEPLDGTPTRVTVLVKQGASEGMGEGTDAAASGMIAVQIAAQSTVNGTAVSAIHVQEWGRSGPAAE